MFTVGTVSGHVDLMSLDELAVEASFLSFWVVKGVFS